jgi:hypothetical protein
MNISVREVKWKAGNTWGLSSKTRCRKSSNRPFARPRPHSHRQNPRTFRKNPPETLRNSPATPENSRAAIRNSRSTSRNRVLTPANPLATSRNSHFTFENPLNLREIPPAPHRNPRLPVRNPCETTHDSVATSPNSRASMHKPAEMSHDSGQITPLLRTIPGDPSEMFAEYRETRHVVAALVSSAGAAFHRSGHFAFATTHSTDPTSLRLRQAQLHAPTNWRSTTTLSFPNGVFKRHRQGIVFDQNTAHFLPQLESGPFPLQKRSSGAEPVKNSWG